MNLICGINPVLEALAAGTRHFDRLLVVKGLRNRRVSEAIARASQLGIPLRFEARETLDRMAGGVPHQGLIAVVSAKPVIDPGDAAGAGARTPALLVVLDGVEDPRNLGAILRTAEAAGADGVLLPERHSAGPVGDGEPRLGGRPRARAGRAHRQRRPGARGAEGARRLGGRLRRLGHRALGRGRLSSGRSRSCWAARAAASAGWCASAATTSCRCRSSATSARSTCPWRRASRSTR